MSSLDFSHLLPEDLVRALDGSALKPPEGVVPNLDHPPNLNSVALAGLFVSLSLSSTFLFLRIYVKIKMRHLSIGDYLMILAYTFYLVVLIALALRTRGRVGFFMHQWDIRAKYLEDYLFHNLVFLEFWLGSVLLVKSSILLEWLQTFAPTGNRLFTVSCKILLVVNVIFHLIAIIVLSLTCHPFKKQWDKTIEGTCTDIKRIHLGVAVVNLILDLAILVLPQPVIWNLQMSKPRKIGVSTIFAIGILAILAAAFMLEAIASWIRTDDHVYYYSSLTLWGFAEITCAILINCVPFAPRFLQDSGLRTILGNSIPLKLYPSRRVIHRDEEQFGAARPRSQVSYQGGYQEIDDRRDVPLENYESRRPTDRQYGIVVTTDIMVTDDGERGHVKLEEKQHPWVE